MTEATSPPIIVEVVKGLWPYLAGLGAVIAAAVTAVWQLVKEVYKNRQKAGEKREREALAAAIRAEKRLDEDRRADIERLERQKQEEIERILEAHLRELAQAAEQVQYLRSLVSTQDQAFMGQRAALQQALELVEELTARRQTRKAS